MCATIVSVRVHAIFHVHLSSLSVQLLELCELPKRYETCKHCLMLLRATLELSKLLYYCTALLGTDDYRLNT